MLFMAQFNIRTLSAVAMVIVVAGACGPKQIPKNFDLGKFNKNRYTNAYFNLSLDIPKNWFIKSQDENDSLMRKGFKTSLGDNEKEIQKKMEEVKNTSATLFTAFKYEPGTNLVYNTNVMLLVEHIGTNLLVSSGKDYLDASKAQLKANNIKCTFLDQHYPTIKLGDRDFSMMRLKIANDNSVIFQNYYVDIINGYAVIFITSWDTTAQTNELQSFLGSIRFGKN